ncbi:hypothetical protein HBI56_184340 [Parastagonospora nodorum]|nr:hypothetical protein HBI10_190370 [Parastagonospora nodorum]KAH4013664.1 hypothetical protein HBI13_179200 [Parastagonospora nodorum]KAH4021288.1 hypothetical protein HBI09_176490 [Parastagonospora nodorum]KAH4116298.1 hypothetical protein HBH47_168700 [Parastagonospora nodorum]KAH4600335.1 hypothetical protein HBH82_190600 [Parastagonospora nodorum]
MTGVDEEPMRQHPTPQEVEQYKSDTSSLAQMKADELFYFPDGERSPENDVLWTKLHCERQARVDAYEEKYLPRRSSPRLQKEDKEHIAEHVPARNFSSIPGLLSPQQQAATCPSRLVDQAVPLPKPLSQLISELQESDLPNLSTEPPRPSLAPRNPGLEFWRDVVDYNVLSDQRSSNTAARAAATAQVKDWVGKLQDVGADLKTWGRWAAAELDKATRLAGLVGQLVDAVGERWKLVKLKEARIEHLTGLMNNAKTSIAQSVQSLNGGIERLVNGKTLSPELTAEVQAALQTINDNLEVSEMCERVAALAAAKEELEEALRVEKSVHQQREEFWSTDKEFACYHSAQTLLASEVQNPKYTQPLGWQDADGSFVQNPYHSYWCGRKLVRYLRKTDGLRRPESLWYKADESEPSYNGVSLKHPLCVSDDRSYWAGIRHELEEVKTSYDTFSWTKLPKAMAEHVRARQI